MMRVWIASLVFVLLGGCVSDVIVAKPPQPGTRAVPQAATPRAQTFLTVVRDVVPVAVSECRRRTSRGTRCDYAIVVDDRPGVPPNAFQTLAPDGQPIIGFTLPLIAIAKNRDELAFVLAHEAAHHIEGHISRGQVSARTGAVLAGAIVALGGGTTEAVRQAQNAGAFYGARRYAKDFELEADALGALLTERAGYDALVGVAFFNEAPDPGNRFLGTHPPNADRIATVRRVVSGLR